MRKLPEPTEIRKSTREKKPPKSKDVPLETAKKVPQRSRHYGKRKSDNVCSISVPDMVQLRKRHKSLKVPESTTESALPLNTETVGEGEDSKPEEENTTIVREDDNSAVDEENTTAAARKRKKYSAKRERKIPQGLSTIDVSLKCSQRFLQTVKDLFKQKESKPEKSLCPVSKRQQLINDRRREQREVEEAQRKKKETVEEKPEFHLSRFYFPKVSVPPGFEGLHVRSTSPTVFDRIKNYNEEDEEPMNSQLIFAKRDSVHFCMCKDKELQTEELEEADLLKKFITSKRVHSSDCCSCIKNILANAKTGGEENGENETRGINENVSDEKAVDVEDYDEAADDAEVAVDVEDYDEAADDAEVGVDVEDYDEAAYDAEVAVDVEDGCEEVDDAEVPVDVEDDDEEDDDNESLDLDSSSTDDSDTEFWNYVGSEEYMKEKYGDRNVLNKVTNESHSTVNPSPDTSNEATCSVHEEGAFEPLAEAMELLNLVAPSLSSKDEANGNPLKVEKESMKKKQKDVVYPFNIIKYPENVETIWKIVQRSLNNFVECYIRTCPYWDFDTFQLTADHHQVYQLFGLYGATKGTGWERAEHGRRMIHMILEAAKDTFLFPWDFEVHALHDGRVFHKVVAFYLLYYLYMKQPGFQLNRLTVNQMKSWNDVPFRHKPVRINMTARDAVALRHFVDAISKSFFADVNQLSDFTSRKVIKDTVFTMIKVLQDTHAFSMRLHNIDDDILLDKASLKLAKTKNPAFDHERDTVKSENGFLRRYLPYINDYSFRSRVFQKIKSLTELFECERQKVNEVANALSTLTQFSTNICPCKRKAKVFASKKIVNRRAGFLILNTVQRRTQRAAVLSLKFIPRTRLQRIRCVTCKYIIALSTEVAYTAANLNSLPGLKLRKSGPIKREDDDNYIIKRTKLDMDEDPSKTDSNNALSMDVVLEKIRQCYNFLRDVYSRTKRTKGVHLLYKCTRNVISGILVYDHAIEHDKDVSGNEGGVDSGEDEYGWDNVDEEDHVEDVEILDKPCEIPLKVHCDIESPAIVDQAVITRSCGIETESDDSEIDWSMLQVSEVAKSRNPTEHDEDQSRPKEEIINNQRETRRYFDKKGDFEDSDFSEGEDPEESILKDIEYTRAYIERHKIRNEPLPVARGTKLLARLQWSLQNYRTSKNMKTAKEEKK